MRGACRAQEAATAPRTAAIAADDPQPDATNTRRRWCRRLVGYDFPGLRNLTSECDNRKGRGRTTHTHTTAATKNETLRDGDKERRPRPP